MMRYRNFWQGWLDKDFQALSRNGSARYEERRRRYELAAGSFVELSPVMAGRAAYWLERSMGAFWPGDEQVRRKAQNICTFLNALPQPVRFPSKNAHWPYAHCAHVLLRTQNGGYRATPNPYNSPDGWCVKCGVGSDGCVGALDHPYAVTTVGSRILIGMPYWTITEPHHEWQSQERYEANRQHGREACAQLDAYLRDELGGQVTALYLRDEDSWWNPPSSALLLLVNTAELRSIAAALRGAGLLPDQVVPTTMLSSGDANNA